MIASGVPFAREHNAVIPAQAGVNNLRPGLHQGGESFSVSLSVHRFASQ
jgi:hypothetical protein